MKTFLENLEENFVKNWRYFSENLIKIKKLLMKNQEIVGKIFKTFDKNWRKLRNIW